MTFERELVQILELDFDFCTRTYGAAPCTASLSASTPRKCFNMAAGCQDIANFDKGTKTLRYARSQNGLPKGTLIYPALKSVSTSPIEINMGGLDRRTGPLGKAARVTVMLQDFSDNDVGLDPYALERRSGAAQTGPGYNPEEFGTHFGRLRARCPYFLGRAARVREGYAGQDIAAMPALHFIVTEWDGPDHSGAVRITLQDVLDQARGEKAVCPALSQGKLDRDIAAGGAAAFTLVPETIGDTYPAEGRASIGSEIVRFTRSGDAVTIFERAVDGSVAASHAADDLFQLCWRCEDAPIGDVARKLMVDYAGIADSRIPDAQWAAESDWMVGFHLTRTIPKPVSVMALLNELAQLNVTWWHDPLADEVRMGANRPLAPGEAAPSITDEFDILAGTLRREDLQDQRLTQIMFFHGVINSADSPTDTKNYRRATGDINDGGAALRHNQDRLFQVHCPWLGGGNDNVASAVVDRLSNRFEDIPVRLTFELDAARAADLNIGDLVTITTRAVQDDIGAPLPVQMQITFMEHAKPGHSVKMAAQSHGFGGRFSYFLSGPAPDYDAASDADRAFGCYLIDGADDAFDDGTPPYSFF